MNTGANAHYQYPGLPEKEYVLTTTNGGANIVRNPADPNQFVQMAIASKCVPDLPSGQIKGCDGTSVAKTMQIWYRVSIDGGASFLGYDSRMFGTSPWSSREEASRSRSRHPLRDQRRGLPGAQPAQPQPPWRDPAAREPLAAQCSR